MTRHVKFVIIENLVRQYEKGKFSDLHFLNLLIQCIYNGKEI